VLCRLPLSLFSGGFSIVYTPYHSLASFISGKYRGHEADITEFHGIEPELLQKALGVLVKRGKAQIFGNEDSQGVKFF
jgi:hypothetical protein